MSSSSPPADRKDAPEPTAPTEGMYTHRQIMVILTGLMSGLFLAALDQTIVATSIRTISDDLHGLNLQAWATTAYLITSTIATPLYGKLSDLWGRRPLYLFAITAFILGSALCAGAQSMYQLALYRAIQGIGAGGLFTLALTIIADLVPPRERARYQGFFLAVFGSSSVLGPVVGGFLAGQDTILGITGWRWVFLINVPIGIVSLGLVLKTLHIPFRRRPHRIDYLGAASLTLGLVPLLILAEQGREWGWTSSLSLATLGISIVGLAGFIWAERAAGDDALLPLKFFSNTTFRLGTIVSFVVGMGMFGGLAAVPLYLQIVRGYSPTEGGLLMVPLVIGIMVGSIVTGKVISKTGTYRRFPPAGLALMMAGMGFLSQVRVDTSLLWVCLCCFIFGLGLGFNMQTLVVAIQNSVPPRDMGVATSAATFFRGVGGTLGAAISLSVLFNTAGENIATAFKHIAPTPEFQGALHDPAVLNNPANKAIIDAVTHGAGSASTGALQDSSFLNHVDPRLAEPFLVGFSQSIDLVFALGTIPLGIAFVLSLFLPADTLSQKSGIQARSSEGAAEVLAS